MGKISFDSTSSIKGIIFQFLVALERCLGHTVPSCDLSLSSTVMFVNR